jgi:uncharacterized protein involved in exopolysaccharide biosynthesis
MASFEIPISRFSPRDLLRILFKRKTSILIFYGAMVFVAALYCFFWPPTYEASVRFLVKHTREEPLISSDLQSVRMISRQAVTENDLNTEMDVLQSQNVVEKTARDLDLEHLPQHWAVRLLNFPMKTVSEAYNWYHHKPNPDAFAASVVRLQKNLFVLPEKKSDIIEVRLRWGDRGMAERLLSGLSENYMAQHLEVTKTPDTRDFFLEQAAAKKSELASIEAQMNAVEPGATLELVRLRQELLARQASDFQNQERKARAGEEQSKAAGTAYVTQLKSIPDRVVYEDKPLFSDQALGSLKARVLQLRLKETELLQKFQPDSRLVKQNEEELKQAEAILANELANPFAQKTTNINSVSQNLSESLLQEQAKESGLSALSSATETEVASIKRELDGANEKAARLRTLDRARRAAEDTYVQYLRHAEDARVEDELNRQRMINVLAIESVHAGLSPVKPNSKLILEIVLSVGLLLALGFGFLLEQLDQSVKTEQDVEHLFGVPVITTFDLMPLEADRELVTNN